ncbi:RagB/SusD family nutrient uptake outer membrane protein [Aureibaculum luteum]|uniref:RagB/SusD family nutrient uptake outer membrane protein n=1 Tax=Aureibaculum luteum TaxID=1548456 RepID=UPI000E501EE2|nr:RagB/SusD family nutrient uptake outer membrane protein [Aureibaculum luteum]
MKNFKNKLIVLIVMTSFLQSCSDYLDQVNPNEVSTDIYYADLEQSDASLTGVYGGMLDTYIVNAWSESLRSDLAIHSLLRLNNPRPNARVTPYYAHTYNSGSFDFNRQWDALYQVIFRSNQLITGLESMDATLKSNDRWTEQMGQARLLRGMCHFYLHAIYNNGEIIIRDKVPGEINEISKSTSSSEDVIKFFREDLVYAYDNLPAAFDEKSRVDKGVAATILGTSHLYEKEYDQAIVYFDDIINNSDYGYALLTGNNVKNMYTQAGEFSSESIFEINYSVALKPEESQFYEESFNTRNARYSAPNGRGGGAPEHYVAAAWLTDAYSTEFLDPLDARNTVLGYNGRDRITDNISLRASSMIALVNDEHTEYYDKPTAAIRETFNNNKISAFKQYTNHDITDHEKNVGNSTWKSGKNVIINRLADVYLMRAEAYLETGNITDALSDINTIRERWALALLGPVVDASKTYVMNEPVTNLPYTDENTLRKHLRHVERPLELNVQGVSSRNIDLRRWGNAQARFSELNGMKYYLSDYEYVKNDGGATATRKNSLLTRSVTGKELYSDGENEFKDAAQNYNESRDYKPLPLSETDNNTNL